MDTFLKLWMWFTKEPSRNINWILPIMMLISITGQEEIKKNIETSKVELVQQIAKVDKKIDVANEKQEFFLKDYNNERIKTEGRLSFLEAPYAPNKRKRPF